MSEEALASRFLRFIAFILDWILTIMVTIMVLGTTRLLESPEAYQGEQSVTLRVLGAGAIAYLLVNGWLLIARGQTMGKFFCRIAIVAQSTGARPAIWVLILRSLVFAFSITFVSHWAYSLAYLVNYGFVVRKDRRCLHDILLQTEVVKYGKEPNKSD